MNKFKKLGLIAAILACPTVMRAQVGVVGDPVLKTADLIVYESGCANGLIATGSGGCSVDEIDVVDGAGATSSNSGFEFGGTGGAQIGLLQGCTASQILKWNDGTSLWECSADAGGQALFFTAPAELTIATGSIALAGAANTITSYTVDTEADAGTDGDARKAAHPSTPATTAVGPRPVEPLNRSHRVARWRSPPWKSEKEFTGSWTCPVMELPSILEGEPSQRTGNARRRSTAARARLRACTPCALRRVRSTSYPGEHSRPSAAFSRRSP